MKSFSATLRMGGNTDQKDVRESSLGLFTDMYTDPIPTLAVLSVFSSSLQVCVKTASVGRTLGTQTCCKK